MKKLQELLEIYAKKSDEFYDLAKIAECIKLHEMWNEEHQETVRKEGLALLESLEEAEKYQNEKFGADICFIDKNRLSMEKEINLALSNEVVKKGKKKTIIVITRLEEGEEYIYERAYTNILFNRVLYLNVLNSDEKNKELIEQYTKEDE